MTKLKLHETIKRGESATKNIILSVKNQGTSLYVNGQKDTERKIDS